MTSTNRTHTPNHLASFDGIHYVMIRVRSPEHLAALDNSSLGGAGDNQYAAIASGCLDLLLHEPEVRVLAGEEVSIHAARNNVAEIVLVMVKGHPVVKSARRHIRNTLAKLARRAGEAKLAQASVAGESEPLPTNL